MNQRAQELQLAHDPGDDLAVVRPNVQTAVAQLDDLRCARDREAVEHRSRGRSSR